MLKNCKMLLLSLLILLTGSGHGQAVGAGDRPLTQYEAVSLRDYFDSRLRDMNTQLGQRIDYVENAIKQADLNLKKLMEGFPNEYAKKLELGQTAALVKDLKEKDVGELKNLIDKKLSKEDYESKHTVLMGKYEELKEKAQGWQTIEANINGKLWTLGIFLGVVMTVLAYLFKFGLHLP